jgi:predicted ATPase
VDDTIVAVNSFIERVKLRNYKSIAACDVHLRALTVVVGRNGSGKSNFVDALHFVADALTTTLDHAFRKRGGMKSVFHRGSPPRLAIELAFKMRERCGVYTIELGLSGVRREALVVRSDGSVAASFERRGSAIRADVAGSQLPDPPATMNDRLALVTLSGVDAFRESYDTLTALRFYRLNPDAIRQIQDPDEGDVLLENGSNLASVWRRLERTDRELSERLTRYVGAIAPEVRRIRSVDMGPKETLRFYQVMSTGRQIHFDAAGMSDGTLRALGALVASRQGNEQGIEPTIVVIEEPETALHPAAIAALMDALREASEKTQIVVTSHSPEVLDHVSAEEDALLVTESHASVTVLAEVDKAGREAIRRHLYTPGELLRMDQLQPNMKGVESSAG